MSLVSAKCPNCDGEIQLDESKEKGFCLFCGSQVYVKTAIENLKIQIDGIVQVAGIAKVDSLYKIAKDTYDDGNHEAAYDLFTKVLTLDPTNDLAQLYRGLSAGWGSTLAKPRYSESINAAKRAIENKYDKLGSSKQFYSFANVVLVENNIVLDAVFTLAKKHYDEFKEVNDSLTVFSNHMNGLVENEKNLFATAMNCNSNDAPDMYVKNLVGLLNHIYTMCIDLLTMQIWKPEYSFGLVVEIASLLNNLEIPEKLLGARSDGKVLAKKIVQQINNSNILNLKIYGKQYSRDDSNRKFILPLLEKYGMGSTVSIKSESSINETRQQQEASINEASRQKKKKENQQQAKGLFKAAAIFFLIPLGITFCFSTASGGSFFSVFQFMFTSIGLIFFIPCWGLSAYFFIRGIVLVM